MKQTHDLPLNRTIALFDSDCLEPVEANGFPLPALPAFGIRERMRPKTERINALYEFAFRHDLTVLFTQCCSAAPVADGSPEGTLVVPMDPGSRGWREKVSGSRFINIEKKTGSGEQGTTRSFICRYFDAFQHNPNIGALLELLDIPTFVLFGHGLDLCVDTSAKGLIAAGRKVHFLTDISAPSASGYGPYGTAESGKSILDYLVEIGVTTGTSEDFLREMKAGRSA